MLKRALHGIWVGLAASALALALWSSGALDRLEYTPWAWRVRALARPSAAAGDIALILIDQASLDWGKRVNGWSWPWPREVCAPILAFCRRAGARSVSVDVLFTEPSLYGVGDDAALGAAVAQTPACSGALFLGTESGDAVAWPPNVPDRSPRVTGLRGWLARPAAAAAVFPKCAFPVPDVATNAALLANVADQPDEDGVFRRAALFGVFDGRAVPALGLAAYLAGAGEAGAPPSVALDGNVLNVDGQRIHIGADGRAILRYAPPSAHRAFSAAAIIQSEMRLQSGGKPVVDPALLKGRHVFLGGSAPALLDLRSTPISRVCPGVEIHATILDNLLTRGFLRDAPRTAAALTMALCALVAALAVTLGRKVWHTAAAFAVCLPVPILWGFVAYAQGVWWPVMAGSCAVAFALVGAVLVNYATEGRQKAFIKQAFRHYLGEAIIDELIADPTRLQLGGEKRELTIFFSDIEKFSTLSERMDPGELTGFLNAYLSDMTEIVFEEGGYVDKYIGDAIVAFWGAPVAQPDQAARACRAALRCQRRLAARRAELTGAATGAGLNMRIGIHTGMVTVGNMGSRHRFNYTVLGDAANVASRLEGANKAFGTYLMVSDATWTAARDACVGRELGAVRVVGRAAPVRVHEIVGLAGEARPAWMAEFARGLQSCRAGDWALALAAFGRCPGDPPARVYAEKCNKLLADPSATWDAVWNLTEK